MSRQAASSAGRATWQTLAYRFAIRSRLASPYGVNGFSTLLVATEQLTPAASSGPAGTTPRGTAWLCGRPIRNRSVAGKMVTATPARASVAASASRRGRSTSDICVTWPTATRPPQP